MRTGGAMLLVAVGLLLLWIVITGRLDQLRAAWGVLQGTATATPAGDASGTPADNISWPSAPTVRPPTTGTPGVDLTYVTSASNPGGSTTRSTLTPGAPRFRSATWALA